MAGQTGIARWTYKMFTEFFYFTRRAGNLRQKYYIGIRERAGTDFIVSPGRPDIWRKCIAGYELIKIFDYISSGKPDI